MEPNEEEKKMVAFTNRTITATLTAAELAELNAFYDENIGEYDLTMKKKVDRLLEMLYQGKRLVNNPETAKQLAEANDKVESLSSTLDIAKQEKLTADKQLEEANAQIATLRQQLTDSQAAATDEIGRYQERINQLETSDSGTIKLTDPELVEELKILQLAVEVQFKQKDDYNTLVKRLIGTCRKANTFVISTEKRKQLKALIK